MILLTGEVEREELIAKLRATGVKHNPDDILRIARLSDSKIVFLEIGNDGSGWQHIRKQHAENFAARGIPEDQIIDAVIAAVINVVSDLDELGEIGILKKTEY